MTAFFCRNSKKYYFVYRARSQSETHSQQHSKRANYVLNVWAWRGMVKSVVVCAEKFKLNCLLSFFSLSLILVCNSIIKIDKSLNMNHKRSHYDTVR